VHALSLMGEKCKGMQSVDLGDLEVEGEMFAGLYILKKPPISSAMAVHPAEARIWIGA
jgi:hypothetical protein